MLLDLVIGEGSVSDVLSYTREVPRETGSHGQGQFKKISVAVLM